MNTNSTASLFLPHASEILPLVEGLLRASSAGPQLEQRAHIRHPYSKVITLTPVTKATFESVGDPVSVVSKEISAGGIGFFHQQVIPHRFVLMPIEMDGVTWLLTRLRWCRFLQPGWYESGGQFVRTVVDPPFGTQ